MTDKPLHIFTVELSVARQWGTEQQVSIDTLLNWSARLSPEDGLKLFNALTPLLQQTVPGAIAPLTESGARALEALGHGKQLTLTTEKG